jgi:hypothetical protein
MTDVGAALLAQCEGGLAKMEFVRLAAGDGQYSTTEKQRTQLQQCTALKAEKQAFDFSGISMPTQNSVLLKALITNAELSTGYYVREVGVFARNALDDSSDPVLYSIAIAEVADYLPPYNGLTPSTITQEYYATVSNSAEVTITTGGGAVALAEDLARTALIVDEMAATVEDISGNMGWMIQNVLGLQMWAELYQKASLDHMSNNTAVEIFDGTTGYIISSGSYDAENHRVIA